MLRSHLFMEAQGRSVSKLFHAFPPRLSKQVADIASPTHAVGGQWRGKPGTGGSFLPPLPSFLAPSAVPTMHLHSSTGNSMTLSWTPPERPNGIILDYEIKYSEKVKQEQPFPSSSPSSWPSAPWQRGFLRTRCLGDVGASRWRVVSQR